MLSTGHGPLDDRIFYKQVLSLAKRYERIYVVTPGEAPGENLWAPRVRFVSLPRPTSLWARFRLLPAAVRQVRRLRPDVCHFHDLELIFALPWLRLFTRARLIYDVHESYPDMVRESEKVPPLLRPLLARLVDVCERTLARLAHHLITADESVARRLRRGGTPVTTIFNYPNRAILKPRPEAVAKLRARYRGRPVLLYCGGLGESKGLYQMIRVVARLRERHPQVLLVLLGQCNEATNRRVQQMLEAWRVREQVELAGWVPHTEIANYLSVARIGLILYQPTPKWHKNIPIKQFEFMAHGVPIVASDLPPISQYVGQVGAGKLVDGTSPRAAADAVSRLLRNEAEWRRCSRAGLRAVRTEWNWSKMEARLLRLYRELLPPQPAKRTGHTVRLDTAGHAVDLPG